MRRLAFVATAVAGLLVAPVIRFLPGKGGHSPADGFKAGEGAPTPAQLPGVLLAALATLSLGVVLGPEAPLIALGGDDTDGTDPMSQALDALSAQYGTLFVVAAGNDGLYGEGTIESPGAAAAALTVGAVDATDTLADFSSVGPETGSEAAKPDLTAPGVDIISARAAGTSNVCTSPAWGCQP